MSEKEKESGKEEDPKAPEPAEEHKEKEEDRKEEIDFGKEEHDKLRDSVKEYSDNMEEKYDKKIAKLTPEEDEGPDFSEMEEKYSDLKKEVSENRKKGKEVFIAHNLLLGFPAAIHMAKATREKEDIAKAESILNEAEQELKDALEFPEVDFRKEVEQKVRKDLGIKTEEELEQEEAEAAAEKRKEKKDQARKELEEITPEPAEEHKEETGKEEKEEKPGIDIDRVPKSKKEYFHLEEKDLKSIRELLEHLPEMTDSEYLDYYYSRGINDFAEWISTIFGYEELAEKIREVKEKEKVAEIIKEEAGL